MKPELPKREDHHELLLPRWAVPLVWAVIISVIQILLPGGISRLEPRFSWSQRSPGLWNLAGLVVVVIGLSFYCWCLVFHFGTYRASVRVGFSPPHLVIAGPYKFSRNPMYVSGLLTWLGWTVYYGSLAVFIAFVLLWFMFAYRVIPQEERQLEMLFDDEYLEYKRSVRRWIGRF